MGGDDCLPSFKPTETEGDSLTDIERIIDDLEGQRDAIGRAIAALREIASVPQDERVAETPATTKRRMSPKGDTEPSKR